MAYTCLIWRKTPAKVGYVSKLMCKNLKCASNACCIKIMKLLGNCKNNHAYPNSSYLYMYID